MINVEEAFERKKSDIPLTIEGRVIKILPDDHEGIHHQRFIVSVPASPSAQGGHPGHTVLIVHNLERAYRANVKIGDKVEVHGTYVWNKFGGLIHNTHHDDRDACRREKNGKIVCGPAHEDGWIIFVGKKSPHRTKNLPRERSGGR